MTRDGRVKILDFGLAKLARERRRRESAPDLRASNRVRGMSRARVGTRATCRPSSAREAGRSPLRIFSLGAILYEMLRAPRLQGGVGRGDDGRDHPRGSAAPLETSPTFPGLERIVAHCLEKDPEQRFQSARDLAFHLEASPLPCPGPGPPPARLSARRGARAGSLLASEGRWPWPPLSKPGADRPSRPAAATSAGVNRLTDLAGLEESPALSPDGKSVVFVRRR